MSQEIVLKIGAAITKAREKKNLSRNQVHIKTNVTATQQLGIEKGDRQYTIQSLIKLCQFLEIKRIDLT